MKKRLFISSLIVVALAAFVAAVPSALAGADDPAVHYYVALGDSLAEGYQPNGDVGHGYADQLYADLKVVDPTLELKNLACGGETTSSMISGVMPWGGLGSRYFCGYRARSAQLAHGSQLADVVAFLRAHRRFVSLITIDIGANDLERVDAQGNLVTCLFDPAGCAGETARVAENLTAILVDLRAAAGPDVPLVGMSYYDAFAPLCLADPTLLFVCGRVDAFNAALVDTYAAAGVPVADVAGAFENDDLLNAAAHVCAWTWVCALGDVHANTAGYGVIAEAFRQAIDTTP
jgi:lysophospholipase L1-like esterase